MKIRYLLAILLTTVISCGGGGGAPDTGDETNPLNLVVTGTTSSSVSVEWDEPATTPSKITVYLSSDPEDNFVEEAETDLNATSYEITNIASGVDLFIKVEIVSGTQTTTAVVHAKTIGGPREVLDSALREVHLFAPNIIQLVLADGDGDGGEWQSGEWTVTRASGAPIEVEHKWRHSIPVSADDYWPTEEDPHIYLSDSDEVTAVDHRIYLVLDEAIGSGEILNIEGPNDLSFRLPFSNRMDPTLAWEIGF